MYAFGRMHAVQSPTIFGGSIQAAMSTPDFKSVRHLFSKAMLDIDSIFPTNGGPITVGQLDALLGEVHSGRLTTVNRIELKNTLARLGLLR
jgi:hypothetical protein